MKNLFKISIHSIVIALILAGCNVTPAVNNLIKTDGFNISFLDEIYNNCQLFPDKTEFSIAVVANDSTKYYGVLRTNDTLRHQRNEESIFEIGSISKVFTSTILAQQVIENEIKLTDNINQYLDYKLNNGINISLRSLSNHTSGMPHMPSNAILGTILNPSNPYKNYSEEKLEEYLREGLQMDYPAGEKSQYSNLGAATIAYVLSKHANKDYQTMLDENIFSNYQMMHSFTSRSSINMPLIKGLNPNGSPASNWDLGAMVGAGGILSTAKDLTKFVQAQFDTANHALHLTQQVTYADSSGVKTGLGWLISRGNNGNDWFWHNGGTGGYKSCMLFDPTNEIGIVVLSNISSFHRNSKNIDHLCFNLAELILNNEEF